MTPRRVRIARLLEESDADEARLGQVGTIVRVTKRRGDGPTVVVRFDDGTEDCFYDDELAYFPRDGVSLLARAAAAPHGTRARYVAAKCRCRRCKDANVAYYHARQARKRAAEASVWPTRSPIASSLERAGKACQIWRCPGACGRRCVVGGAWLKVKSKPVCDACVTRHTVWNGLVDAGGVLRHLRKLSRRGVGYRSVADAAGVSVTVLQDVRTRRKTRVRAELERRVLAVDEDAAAGGSKVSARRLHRAIRTLRALGFSRAGIARELGYRAPAIQLGRHGRARFERVVALEKLVRRVERGEVRPPVSTVGPYRLLRELVACGIDPAFLWARLGFRLNLAKRPLRMLAARADAILELRRTLELGSVRESSAARLEHLASSRSAS